MLKRLVGVVIVKEGWAVQSYGYRSWRVSGRVEVAVENLDHWQVDEILLVCIDRSRQNAGPDFELMDRLRKLRITTPFTYMGGVRSVDDAVGLVRAGADRIALEGLFNSMPERASAMAAAIGRQAVIRAQTVARRADRVMMVDYINGQEIGELTAEHFAAHEKTFSELLIIDQLHDGGMNAFDATLIEPLWGAGLQIICMGGISEKGQVQELFARVDVSAVAVGNVLTRGELAHRTLVDHNEVTSARVVNLGDRTRGAREW